MVSTCKGSLRAPAEATPNGTPPTIVSMPAEILTGDREDLERMAAANWVPTDARRAVAQVKRSDSFQRGEPLPRLLSRNRTTREELATRDSAVLPTAHRVKLLYLVKLRRLLTGTE